MQLTDLIPQSFGAHSKCKKTKLLQIHILQDLEKKLRLQALV